MDHTILFTGHMIDGPDREVPRFPPEKETNVEVVLEAHLKALISKLRPLNQDITGIAGAACGGDLLFHGLCGQLNIKTEVYLPLPVEQFKKKSVSFAGKTWEDRFDRLIGTHKVRILPEGGKDVWKAANLWMLEEGCKNGPGRATLLALWDLNIGDGDGGTEQMIRAAEGKGISVTIIDITKIH